MNKIIGFIKDDSGATLVEYALLAGLVAVAAIAAMTTLGGSINTEFTEINNKLTTAGNPTPSQSG